MTAIQEKIVEALRAKFSTDATLALTNNVFLLLRVLLFRFSPEKIDSFWPVIITELMRVYIQPSPMPPLVVAATKFLEFALLISPARVRLL